MQIFIKLVHRTPPPNSSSAYSSEDTASSYSSRPIAANNCHINNYANMSSNNGAVTTTTAVGFPVRKESTIENRIRNWVPRADQEAFKTAFYIALMLVFLAISTFGLIALYHLLYAFLKPIMWAFLVGTVLFPAKRHVTDFIRNWLVGLRESHTPLAVGITMLPIQWLNSAAESMWNTMLSFKGLCIVAAYFGLKILTYRGTFVTIVGWTAKVYRVVDMLILFFAHKYIVALFVLYTCVFLAWVYLQSADPNKGLVRWLSVPVWIFVLTNVANFFWGPLRVIVLLATSTVILLLATGVIGSDSEQNEAASEEQQTNESLQNIQDEEHPGNVYLRAIIAGCVLLWTVNHTWLLYILAVPFVYAFMKRFGESLGVFNFISNLFTGGDKEEDGLWFKVKRVLEISIHHAIRDFFKLLFTSDRKMVKGLENSMDLLSTTVIMIAVSFGSVLLCLFVVFQVHAETVHLARLAGEIMASGEQRPAWLSSALNYTGEQLNGDAVEQYVEQGYVQGRAWLATQVRQLADPKDTERADMLEAQVKQLVDHIYHLYENRDKDTVMAAASAQAVSKPSVDLWTHLQHATDIAALKKELTLIVTENIGMIMAIGESIWGVLLANVSFLSSFAGAILGVLLGFGMDLLNFFIQTIIFLTMVYYLLANSTQRWKPLEWFSRLAPIGDDNVGASQTGLTAAVEQAISGVFVLSAKMAMFYGFWTYFVHSLFSLNVVFVPSVLAALLAAIPLTPPYAVAVVGVLELWLAKGELGAALLFLACSVCPVAFADSAFYHEVKGTHPYLTGLAIVGGMYWLGLAGAIIGPIILCCVLVLINVYTSMTY